MISGRGWSTLACCRESSRAEKWSSNGPLAGRSMGASGAGAPNQPELPAAANLPLVHPIALPVSLGIVDQPVALADEVVVQRPQGGPQLTRRCDGAPAVRLAPEVMRDGADAIETGPGVRCRSTIASAGARSPRRSPPSPRRAPDRRPASRRRSASGAAAAWRDGT